MISSYFTSQFVKDSPQALRRLYNNLLIKSLLSLIDTAANGLRQNYQELKTMISSIDPDKKISQELHALHALLTDALKTNNTSNVITCIRSIFHSLSNPYTPPLRIETVTFAPWEHLVLETLKEQNRSENGELPTIKPVDEQQIKMYAKSIDQALELLERTSPLFYEEFKTHVSSIEIFDSNRLVGMTDPRVFGTIYICIPRGDPSPIAYFCEHIIHETSHLHLNTLFSQDRLILNGFEERYKAPIRPDLRPMYGIFHATFVLSRMVRVFAQLSDLLGDHSIEKYLCTFKRQFMSGYNTIINHAKLTDLGEKIVQSYSDLISANK